jgi:phospholipid/cholesterol/gamma-HCH transport system substrate-binding protein
MKKIDINIGREVKIGLFAVVMIAGLYFGVNYIKGLDVFSNERVYYVLFDNTTGLKNTAPVVLRGVPVGSVTQIALKEEHPGKVMVTTYIKKSVRIPSDSRMVLRSNGLMGERTIEMVSGTASNYFEKGAFIPGSVAGDLMATASDGIGTLVDEAKTLLTSLNTTAARLNTILEENAEGVGGIVANIETVSRQLSSAGLDRTLHDLGEFSTMLKNNTGRVDSIVGNLDRVAGDLAEADLRATLDTLGASIGHLNAVLGKLSDGDGTMARLLDDPALYDSLTVATGNLSVLLEDLRANPGRYVQFSMFGRKEKKDKK